MQKTGYNKYYQLTDIGPYNRPIRYRSNIGICVITDRQNQLIGRYRLIHLIGKSVTENRFSEAEETPFLCFSF